MNYSNYLSVYELTTNIKNYLENNSYFKKVLIKGEISNLKIHTSGHWYFTLKDEKSRISAVMFASYATRCKMKINEGMQVLISASLGVYEAGGNYQLYVTSIEPDGLGILFLQFEELKKKLYQEGIFALEAKVPLPRFPMRIGIISASTGAAVHDILTTLKRRWPIAERILIPTLVQGRDAAPAIVCALQTADNMNFDVIILARGGGSIEDLWAFNEEIVAYAIYQMKTPIISGIGHEVDVTIADYVADYRAPTPTGAAEIATPNIVDIKMQVSDNKNKMNKYLFDIIKLKSQKLNYLSDRNIFKNIDYIYENKFYLLDNLSMRLQNAKTMVYLKFKEYLREQINRIQNSMNQKINSYSSIFNYFDRIANRFKELYGYHQNQFIVNVAKLDALSPLKIMSRGYLMAYDKESKIIKSINDIKVKEEITLNLADGTVKSIITKIEEKENGN